LVRRGYSPTGGAEKFLGRFAAAARAHGHDVLLVNDRPWPVEACGGAAQQTLPVRGPWEFARAVARWREGWPDGLVFSLERLFSADCYRAGDGVLAAWLQRRAVYDPCWESRLRSFFPKQRRMLHLERHCFAAGDTGAVIVNSNMVAREIAAYSDYPSDRVHLVRNAVPDDFAAGAPSRGEARRRLGLPEDRFIAAFVGTGWKRKGLRFAATALRRARQQRQTRETALNRSGADVPFPGWEALKAEQWRDPNFPIVANVHAEPVVSAVAAQELLLQQLTAPVQWTRICRRLVAQYPDATFVEIGSGAVLTGLLRRLAPSVKALSCGTVAEVEQLLCLGDAHR
jgi:glycosyltransferase involved in cell wall biosynthesis